MPSSGIFPVPRPWLCRSGTCLKRGHPGRAGRRGPCSEADTPGFGWRGVGGGGGGEAALIRGQQSHRQSTALERETNKTQPLSAVRKRKRLALSVCRTPAGYKRYAELK